MTSKIKDGILFLFDKGTETELDDVDFRMLVDLVETHFRGYQPYLV